MEAHEKAPEQSEDTHVPTPAEVGDPPALSVEQVRAAIEHDRFVVFSQPILDLRTGAVASEELLVRIQTPDGQLIQPFAFLATAEAFGLASEIDAVMVDKGIELARRGRQVSVNLSAHSLSEPGLIERVEKAVERRPRPQDPHLRDLREQRRHRPRGCEGACDPAHADRLRPRGRRVRDRLRLAAVRKAPAGADDQGRAGSSCATFREASTTTT